MPVTRTVNTVCAISENEDGIRQLALVNCHSDEASFRNGHTYHYYQIANRLHES